ncbi:MAG: hypothetical protein ACM4D3_03840 [Candidatus Sericytochromatia bacterium]
MAWYLALQSSAHMAHQSSIYELQDSADVDEIAQEMVSSATLDRVVAVPAVLAQNPRRQQKVTLYVRPAAWGMWTFYQQSEEDRRQLVEQFNALTQAAQQRAQMGPTAQTNPLTGHMGPGSPISLGNRR